MLARALLLAGRPLQGHMQQVVRKKLHASPERTRVRAVASAKTTAWVGFGCLHGSAGRPNLGAELSPSGWVGIGLPSLPRQLQRRKIGSSWVVVADRGSPYNVASLSVVVWSRGHSAAAGETV